MKLKKIAASVLAAAVAFSAFAFSASAEEAKDEKFTLMTSELTADLKTNMVFVEGVGVVDITGAIFDSSENGNADEDANLDVDFDGISYLSQENLKIWKETGVLTLEKLKADFDTTGLKWGMFHAQNGYVQLVKMEKQMVENDWGEEEEQDVVTYRGLYKIENGEIKKCCDLDTFWTTTRADGISVGFEIVSKDLSILLYVDEDPREFVSYVEFKMVVTQPDGKKTETVIAKADDFDSEIKLPIIHNDETGYDYYDRSILDDVYDLGRCSWSVPYGGDILANVGFAKFPLTNLEAASGGWNYEVGQVYKDGTYKKIYTESSEGTSAYFDGILGGNNGFIIWSDSVVPKMNSLTLHGYNSETGKIESYGHETFERGGEYGSKTEDWFLNEDGDYTNWTFNLKYYSDKFTVVDLKVTDQVYVPDENNPDDPTIIGGQHGTYKDVVLADGYVLLNGLKDFDNWESKTYYEKIVYQGVTKDGTDLFKFETKDGKIGFMDANEKILAEFDAAEGFTGTYASVVKDGKAYLIDENMNAVSDEIEADDIVAVADDLFFAKKGDKTYFVTYGGEVEEPATETVVVDYAEDVIPDGASLFVKAVTDKTDETKVTYEISFKNEDGTEVQPRGRVTVKIPIPEMFAGRKLYVYRAETDGTYTDMNAYIEGDYIVFKTNHFSEYVVTTDGTLADTGSTDDEDEDYDTDDTDDDDTGTNPSDSSQSTADKSPNTGFGGIAVTLGVFAVAGAAVLVSRKKTR